MLDTIAESTARKCLINWLLSLSPSPSSSASPPSPPPLKLYLLHYISNISKSTSKILEVTQLLLKLFKNIFVKYLYTLNIIMTDDLLADCWMISEILLKVNRLLVYLNGFTTFGINGVFWGSAVTCGSCSSSMSEPESKNTLRHFVLKFSSWSLSKVLLFACHCSTPRLL